QWYRYHHLFADVLQAHLMEEQPNQVSTLHQRASDWYEQNDLPSEAIRHALAAQDFERAADLIERVWLAMDLNYQSATWLGWAKALPDDLIRARPVLSLGYAWALLNGGELEAAETRLRDAERWLEPKSAAPSSRGPCCWRSSRSRCRCWARSSCAPACCRPCTHSPPTPGAACSSWHSW
ncbi:MAG TPA: hypothetical protein VLE94_08950, partial [Burkholderiaceae bacterium]|nr:hypothetical protein [Burkholderiaceae bacterium]